MSKFLLFLLGLICLAQVWMQPTYLSIEASRSHDVPDLFFLPPANVLKFVSLDFDEMLADFVWVKAILYFSQQFFTTRQFDHLGNLVEVITDLDPRFDAAYLWAGSVFMYNGSAITRKDIEETNRFLKKGWNFYQESLVKWKISPSYWRIPFMIGFNHAIELREKEEGVRYLRAAAQFPNAPDYVKTWSSTILRRLGRDEEALSQVQEQFTIETLRANLKMAQNEKLKTELRNRILYFYKKIGRENASQEEVSRYEARLQRLYKDYFDNFPFLNLEFYSLLYNDDQQRDSLYSAGEFARTYGLQAF